MNSKNEPLAGAQFVLKDAAGNCVPVALDSNTGRYKVSATLEANNTNATVTSDADGKIYVDCTLGGGGHSELILKRIQPNGRLISFDVDSDAINAAEERLKSYKNLTFL